MPLHHEANQILALLLVLVQELLSCRENADRVGLNLDLCHRFHVHGDTLAGVEVLGGCHVEAHQLQRQLPGLLDHRPDDFTAPLDDLGAAKAVDDQCLVRPDLPEQRRRNGNEQQENQH